MATSLLHCTHTNNLAGLAKLLPRTAQPHAHALPQPLPPASRFAMRLAACMPLLLLCLCCCCAVLMALAEAVTVVMALAEAVSATAVTVEAVPAEAALVERFRRRRCWRRGDVGGDGGPHVYCTAFEREAAFGRETL